MRGRARGTERALCVLSAVTDRRWQLVLVFVGAEAPPFAKGTLAGFRARLIENDLDRALVKRSVQLAAATKG